MPKIQPPSSPQPSGSQKCFWEVSGIYLSSSLKKYHQNCKEFRFLRKLPPPPRRPPAPFSPPPPPGSPGSQFFGGSFQNLSQLKLEESSPKLQRMQILGKLLPPPPRPSCPPDPLGFKLFLGVFKNLSQIKFEEISPTIPRIQILRKLSAFWPPVYSPPWHPWESKFFLGCFWQLSNVKFEEILPKIPRTQILSKLAPPALPLITIPPDFPGSQKNFWEVSGIYLSSSLKKYHQKC